MLGVCPGGMLKLRFDWYINWVLPWSKCNKQGESWCLLGAGRSEERDWSQSLLQHVKTKEITVKLPKIIKRTIRNTTYINAWLRFRLTMQITCIILTIILMASKIVEADLRVLWWWTCQVCWWSLPCSRNFSPGTLVSSFHNNQHSKFQFNRERGPIWKPAKAHVA